LDAAVFEVAVYLLVMDHLAEEEHAFIRIFLQGAIAYFDGILHPIAETEMTGYKKADGAQVNQYRIAVLFSGVGFPSQGFYSSSEGRTVVLGDIKIFDW
jgi:hypothetical protein